MYVHFFPGAGGIAVALVAPCLIYCFVSTMYRKFPTFNMDIPEKQDSFDPILSKYLKITEVVIGLAAGSIVLLVGSSALHGGSQHLPSFYATPLFLLVFSIIYGVTFSVWLIVRYEDYRHRRTYTRHQFALSNG